MTISGPFWPLLAPLHTLYTNLSVVAVEHYSKIFFFRCLTRLCCLERDSANKEALVMSTEAAVQAQMVSYVQTASAPNDDNDGNSAEK